MDALAVASTVALAWQAVRPSPLDLAGLRIDRVTALFGLLVAGIGAVTVRYSLRALAGDPARERFAVQLVAADGETRVVTLGAGDFAAARAFLAMGTL